MKKLYIQLRGGLGNQLYIVATGINLAKAFGMELIVDTSIFNKYKLHKVTVNKFLNNVVLKDMAIKIRNRSFLNFKKEIFNKIKESKSGYDESILKKLNKNNKFFNYYLIGYFQSLNYFKSSLPFLKKEIKKNILKKNPELKSERVKKILENSIAIHIRRKDKLNDQNKKIYGNIKKKELIRILESIYERSKYKYVLLISDDNKFAKELQKELFSKFNTLESCYISRNMSIEHDFYYLMNSKGLILNNSSFSLWAGYLSNSKDIYYPNPLFPNSLDNKPKMPSENDIILDNWKKYKIKFST